MRRFKTDELPSSLIAGFIISIVIILFFHFFGKWSASPKYNNLSGGFQSVSSEATASTYSYSCPLGGTHYFEGDGELSMQDVLGEKFSKVRVNAAISDSFERHWAAILILTLILSLIITLYRNN